MRRRAILLLTLGLVAAGLVARQRPPAQPPKASPLPRQAPPQAAPDFRIPTVVTNVVAPVTVTDGNGDFVMDLKPESFRVLDNDARQQINVELAEMPLSLVILVGNSARMEPLLPKVQKLGTLFTNLVMGATGEAAVITFDHRVEVAQDFTGDAELVEKAFQNLRVGSGQARLSDAVVRALSMLSSRPAGRRRVIMIIAEGRDAGSETDLGFVLSEAQRGSISIYAVGLSATRASLAAKPPNPGPSQFPIGAGRSRPGLPEAASASTGGGGGDLLTPLMMAVRGVKGIFFDHPLEAYAQGTGAVHIGGFSTQAIQEAVSRIGRELRSQYLVSYVPNNLREPAFHTIKVTVERPGVKVRTKPGYYYPGDGTAQPPPGQ